MLEQLVQKNYLSDGEQIKRINSWLEQTDNLLAKYACCITTLDYGNQTGIIDREGQFGFKQKERVKLQNKEYAKQFLDLFPAIDEIIEDEGDVNVFRYVVSKSKLDKLPPQKRSELLTITLATNDFASTLSILQARDYLLNEQNGLKYVSNSFNAQKEFFRNIVRELPQKSQQSIYAFVTKLAQASTGYENCNQRNAQEELLEIFQNYLPTFQEKPKLFNTAINSFSKLKFPPHNRHYPREIIQLPAKVCAYACQRLANEATIEQIQEVGKLFEKYQQSSKHKRKKGIDNFTKKETKLIDLIHSARLTSSRKFRQERMKEFLDYYLTVLN